MLKSSIQNLSTNTMMQLTLATGSGFEKHGRAARKTEFLAHMGSDIRHTDDAQHLQMGTTSDGRAGVKPPKAMWGAMIAVVDPLFGDPPD